MQLLRPKQKVTSKSEEDSWIVQRVKTRKMKSVRSPLLWRPSISPFSFTWTCEGMGDGDGVFREGGVGDCHSGSITPKQSLHKYSVGWGPRSCAKRFQLFFHWLVIIYLDRFLSLADLNAILKCYIHTSCLHSHVHDSFVVGIYNKSDWIIQ